MNIQINDIINASGTLTSLGGCRTRPEVVEAMSKIAGKFVSLAELHQNAGEHLAQILGVEAAMVTSGAAAGLTIATAACMVGDDPMLASQLPDPPVKNKVIIQCSHRNPFERAIKLAGAALSQIGDAIQTRPIDLESALDEDVAAVVFFLQGEMFDASLSLSETLDIAHTHAIPVIVDAAAELPPKENLWKLSHAGADLVLFSGSKDLRGPQASGLIIGRADLVKQSMAQTAPHEHVAGRPMKAGKESVVGLVKAVEMYLQEDEASRFEQWEEIGMFLLEKLNSIRDFKARRFTPSQPYIQPACVPRIGIKVNKKSHHTPTSLKDVLWSGNPRISVEVIQDEILINPHTLTLKEAEVIVQRIRTILGSDDDRGKPPGQD